MFSGRDIDVKALGVATGCGLAATVLASLALGLRQRQPGLFVPSTVTRGPLRFVLGHLPEIWMGQGEAGAAQVDQLHEAARAGKSAIQGCGLGMEWVTPLDPRDLEYILLERAENYIKPPHYDAVKLFIGDTGLVVLRDEAAHTVQRRLLAPAFSPSALAVTYDKVVGPRLHESMAEVEAMASSAPSTATTTDTEKGVLVLEPAFDRFALNVVSEAAFRETNMGGFNVAHEFDVMVTNLAKAWYMFMPHGHLIRTATVRAVIRARDNVRKVAQYVIEASRRKAGLISQDGQVVAKEQKTPVGTTSIGDDRRLLIDYMLEAPELSDENIKDHSITFLLAGHETTSTTLMWAAYSLAKHPAVQQQLFEETKDAFGLDQVPSLETLRGMPYLNNVAKETLRMFPPVTGLGRTAVRDDILPHSGVFIPAGSEVLFYIFGMHHNPALWGSDAGVYRPERWEDPTLEERVGPAGFMPFSVGKRNCIGKEFAMNELLASLATLVRRFHLAIPAGAKDAVRQEKLTMRSKDPIALKVTKRLN